MSSASSIENRVRADVGGATPDPARVEAGTPAAAADYGFRPWHFFVLASLAAATAAVVMSRQTSPEHLILISLTIAAAGFAAAGFHRMLAPLAADDLPGGAGPLSDRVREALEREKALTLRSIKELEFDQAMGKVSQADFESMAGRLRARAIALMKDLDADRSGYRAAIERELESRLAGREPAAVAGPGAPAGVRCAACGTDNDSDAAFCKRCGARVAAAPSGAP